MTLRDRAAALVATAIRRPPYQERLRLLIAERARGKTFTDVGCLWNVDGAYAFHALDNGAIDVIGVDVSPATDGFYAENARRESRVHFVHGDINDAALAVAPTDVVFCSGVLYHVPNPILTLERLRRLTRSVLILGTAIIPELEVPQGAIYYPFLDAARAEASDTGRLTRRWGWIPPSSAMAGMRTSSGV